MKKTQWHRHGSPERPNDQTKPLPPPTQPTNPPTTVGFYRVFLLFFGLWMAPPGPLDAIDLKIIGFFRVGARAAFFFSVFFLFFFPNFGLGSVRLIFSIETNQPTKNEKKTKQKQFNIPRSDEPRWSCRLDTIARFGRCVHRCHSSLFFSSTAVSRRQKKIRAPSQSYNQQTF